MKVSFDFDSTLSEPWVQEIAKMYINTGHEVWITTTRCDKIDFVEIENSEVFEIAKMVGIDKNNITFTNYQDKESYLIDFDIHFDDDDVEIDLINRSKNNKCHGILINYKRYIPNV